MVWSDTTVHSEEPFDRVWLRLSTAHDGAVRIQVDQQAVNSGLCTPAIATRSPALVEGGSLAYFTIRRIQGRWQFGAIGHGPASEQLATRIVEQIQAWDRERTGTPVPSEVDGKLVVRTATCIYATEDATRIVSSRYICGGSKCGQTWH